MVQNKILRALISVAAVVAVFMVAFLGQITRATAAAAPAWAVMAAGVPSLLPSGTGRKGRFDVLVENVGGLPSESGPVVRDQLPPGLIAISAVGAQCEGLGSSEVDCAFGEQVGTAGFAFLTIEFEEAKTLTPGSSLHNVAHVSGGGAAEVVAEASIRVRSNGEKGPGPVGISHFSIDATGPGGESVSQAGGHPNLFTTSVLLNSQYVESENEPVKPVEPVKDLAFYLPLGMLGNATVADQCPASLVETQAELSGCPSGSRVGTIAPLILSTVFVVPHSIYNLSPERGYAAEFAFAANSFTFVTYASVVRRNGTYIVRIAVPGIPSKSALIGLDASFFGDLKEPGESETFDRGAFLSDPTNCDEAPADGNANVAFDTWEHQDSPFPVQGASFEEASSVFPQLSGCALLNFSANLAVQPETTQADEPSGYEVGLEVPQAPNDFSGLGTPPVKDATVTLPAGTSVSPSSANGLEACPETGAHGIDIEGPESEEARQDGLTYPAKGKCPTASQIATVKASTPLLQEELEGRMFLAKPECGGEGQLACTTEEVEKGHLIGLYLELDAPKRGIVVKLKGHASIKGGTGQITASFAELPQFPFSKFVVATNTKARAPLENAQVCGPQLAGATVTPWAPGAPIAHATSTFTVDWNGEGQTCPGSQAFTPQFSAGTTNPTAAATSLFNLALKREDREQDPDTLSTTFPEGLLANISKIARCPEPQASQASLSACPASSQIGTTTVAVGPGNDPYYETGKVFFTGPYRGAPFGLSVVVPAVAGPFNLGEVLVRAKLYVDPHTSEATTVSDPLPQELDGIPLRMRVLNITLTNEEFVLNPTSCAKMSINATVTSTIGGTANLSSPFTAKGCDKLRFRAAFSASTEARSTKVNGTGVKIKIAFPSSGEANIAKVVLGFPRNLPVRLETLQKACLAATFEANPASCPAASNVGTATVHTPILSSPLAGPIYLVSHGNAKFPDAVVVLQGEGLTLEVDGQSFVSKAGALTATFASVPDAPFSTFEASLPAGRYSQFTSVRSVGRAQGSQCGENLVVPVRMVAHNGAELKENARMQIAGCPLLVSILRVRVAGARLAVSVRTSAEGRLTIHGAGVKTLVRPGLAAGTHRLKIALTAGGRAAVRAHGKTGFTVGLVAGKRKTISRKRIAL